MNNLIKTGAVLAAIAVILGAFGAHKLKELIDERALANWETGVKYQMYHALGIVLAGIIYAQSNLKNAVTSSRLFLAGILFFSGSLYLLSLRTLLPFNVLWLGPVTPIGGVFFILGWLRLLVSENTKN